MHRYLVPGAILDSENLWLAQQTFADDILLRFGNDGDIVLLNRSTSLAADEELTGVIEGTSDHQGVAANSLILSNITNDGDIIMLVSDGGNSLEFLLANADVADLQLGHGMATVNIKTASGAITMTPGTDTLFANGTGVVIGHTAQIASGDANELQVLGTSAPDSSMTLGRWSADGGTPAVHFVKSRNATIGSNAIVQDNDIIGGLFFFPDDGGDFADQAARFFVEVDDPSPEANGVGTAFVWDSKPGGGTGASREVMRISAPGTLSVLNGVTLTSGRLLQTQGADVSSADEMALGLDGNYFDITGSTTINHITKTGWQAGSVVFLQFDASVTVTHNSGSPTGTEASLLLAGAGDFSATAGDTLTLVYDGTTFREIARTVI